MSLEQLKNTLPEYAKDIKLNLSSVLSEEGALGLTLKQIYGIALACAYTCKNELTISSLKAEATSLFTEQEIEATKAAAVIMAMNNIYYRAIHLMDDKSFLTMPAQLRMNIIANPGIDKVDFELFALAVSAINGCGMCINAHIKKLNSTGVNSQAIQSTLRIAAVINAASLGITLVDL